MAEMVPEAPLISGFSFVRPLGAGGFAHVYLFEQDMPRRTVAIKVLDHDVHSARDRSEFEAEADAMACLSSHPSIVSVWAAGISMNGKPYIAMEYCPESMRDRSRGNPLPLNTVLDAGVRLAGALETAHRANILHRDIKPSNVLITATGRPALTDFGISMLQGRGIPDERARAMSIPWAAPEVLSHATAGTVASEIWSLGATLYTFAAGRSPFERDSVDQNTQHQIVRRIAKGRYTPVPGAQGYEPFDAVMARAMQLRPDVRFGSMREFAEALQQVQRHYGFPVTPLDVVDDRWAVSAPLPEGVRTPAPVSVRASSRAQRRAARDGAGVDRDGVAPDRPMSPIVAGLLGAGVVTLLGTIGLAIALAAGWIG